MKGIYKEFDSTPLVVIKVNCLAKNLIDKSFE